jgi:hypothetical protein
MDQFEKTLPLLRTRQRIAAEPGRASALEKLRSSLINERAWANTIS